MAKKRSPSPAADPVSDDAVAAIAEPATIKPQELAERLADPEFRERVEAAIASLPPDKAVELVALLEASIRRRKIELFGYLASAAILLVGMVIALYAFGAAAQGTFIGWVRGSIRFDAASVIRTFRRQRYAEEASFSETAEGD